MYESEAKKNYITVSDRLKAEVRRSIIATTVREQHPRPHHKAATDRKNGIQLYVIANLDKSSLLTPSISKGETQTMRSHPPLPQ